MFKLLLAGLFMLANVLVEAQTAPSSPEDFPQHSSIEEFGLAYPLSNDWIRAIQLMRKRYESSNGQHSFDILLAAIYVPKSNLSPTSPFFSVSSYRQPATDCKKSLEVMIASSQGKKEKAEGGVAEFTAAGRRYFRVNMSRGIGGRRQSVICTAANDHLLVWNAGAPNDKGMDAIVATLDSISSITPALLPPPSPTSPEDDDSGLRDEKTHPDRVKAPSGITSGLLIKKVNPAYPADARMTHIQGTVVLEAEISEEGDIVKLELVDGPIELAGSAVTAVRQWKYKPYLLMGSPVAVETQIQVNYQLSR